MDDRPRGAAGRPAPATSTPTHEIGAVQGSGHRHAAADQSVTVRGIVVGDLPGLAGFYLQDVDGDGNTATSDGIFVFSPVAVDLGDTVAVTGTASEFFGQTQIAAGSDAAVCADGTAANLPAAAALDLPADDAARERLEGMLVDARDALTVSEVFDLTSFGELTLSQGGLLVQPTELARPGTAGRGDRRRQHGAPHRAGRRPQRAGHRDTPPYLTPTTRSASVTCSTSPSRGARASASASGGSSRPTAPLPASSPRRTPGRSSPTRWAATSRSARSTC